jgi:4-oxalmesaconate hydratase
MHLLVSVVGVNNLMFASEMLGGVTIQDPLTGRMFDDNKPCLDALSWLTDEDRVKIFEQNVRKVYPRLDAALDMRQAAPSAPSLH